MPKPKSPQEWLAAFQADLMRRDAAIRSSTERRSKSTNKPERSMSNGPKSMCVNRPRLIEILDKLGIKEQQWCRTLGRGFSYSTVMRRLQILKGHDRYLRRRDEVGDNGCYGLEYAAYLARPEKPETETSSRPTRPQIVDETSDPDPDHRFLTGEAHVELPKMSPGRCKSASPAQAIGRGAACITCWEMAPSHCRRPTTSASNRRGKDTSTMSCDAISAHSSACCGRMALCSLCSTMSSPILPASTMSRPITQNRTKLKLSSQVGFRSQDTTYLAPKGNWLGLPFRFAMAMMDDGWFWRDLIIWDKGSLGRKESTDSRCRHNFEYILMFTLSASGYWYNQDALRIPLAGGQPYSVNTGYSTPGRHKPGVLRKDGDRDFRVASNPLGRVADAVWHIPPSGGHGSHSASFPEELVRRALLLTAPPREMLPLATVIDIYGGSWHRLRSRQADGFAIHLYRLESDIHRGGAAARAGSRARSW